MGTVIDYYKFSNCNGCLLHECFSKNIRFQTMKKILHVLEIFTHGCWWGRGVTHGCWWGRGVISKFLIPRVFLHKVWGSWQGTINLVHGVYCGSKCYLGKGPSWVSVSYSPIKLFMSIYDILDFGSATKKNNILQRLLIRYAVV